VKAPAQRLLHVGNVIVDIVLRVPELPVAGSDVLAAGAGMTPGAGFNVMIAAVRQGMAVVHGGAHGTGPFGDMIRGALRDAGIEVAQPTSPGPDSGFCVALVDATGERTFVTSVGAEAGLTAADLDRVDVRDDDVVHVSGYSLLSPTGGPALAGWLDRLPASVSVVVDPQPLVADVPGEVLGPVLRRADWWTCNDREAALMTGAGDPVVAARELIEVTGRAGVLVRAGAAGCVLLERGGSPRHVPAYPVQAVDTNGAGDAHVGVFVAALAGGATPVEGVHRANAAAALATTRFGPATAPTRGELDHFLQTRADRRPEVAARPGPAS
jgi:sugar/nucleoside kinase (ribokinase family)